jgi:hypothetical protein
MQQALSRGFILVFLCGCTAPKVAGPDTSGGTGNPDSGAQTDDSHGPVETGWPVSSGDDVAMVDTTERSVKFHYNTEAMIDPVGDDPWTIPTSNAQVLICDLNADGLDDVWVLSGFGGGNLAINVYKNTGAGIATAPGYSLQPGFSADNFTYACGELSGAGGAELIAYKPDAQKIFIYPNTDGTIETTAVVKPALSGSVSAAWLTGDFDGDGTDELAQAVNGTLTAWHVTDGVPQTSAPLFSVDVADDYGLTTLDYDGDGKDDLGLWSGSALIVWPRTSDGFDTAHATAFTLEGSGVPLGADVR